VRIIALVEYATLSIGILAVVAGKYFALRDGLIFGVFMVGAGIALGGIEGVATRRMGLRSSEEAYENYAGAPALIVAILLLLAGATTIAAGYLLAEGRWDSTVAYLTRRPAALLAASAIPLIGIGVLMMHNPMGRGGFVWTLLVYIPRSLVGLILVLAGVGAIGLAAWEFLQPQAFDNFLRKLPSVRDAMHTVRQFYRSL
jgi:hypothetical protein